MPSPLTLQQALSEGRRLLTEAGVDEASLESELLLRHILNAGIVDVYLKYDQPLSTEDRQAYFALITRRVAGEPSAYITGQKDFYGLSFYVNSSVLIPRPETELLVEKTLESARYLIPPQGPSSLSFSGLTRESSVPSPNSKPKTHYSQLAIADIGAGSGIISVVLAKRLPQAKIYAVDISPGALETALRNARRHGVEDSITFLRGCLLEPLPEPVDIIAANLPYVKNSELPPTGEPACALDGGPEGLDVIESLLAQVPGKLKPGGKLLLEIGLGQAQSVREIIKNVVPESNTQLFTDLAGIERIIVVST
jgi:release factor glutamine methyltransferase